jgi:hypothetical protein
MLIKTLRFAAPIEAVWNAVLTIVDESDYQLKTADEKERRIVYYKSKSGVVQWAWNRFMVVTMLPAGTDATVVAIRAETMGQFMLPGVLHWLEGKLTSELVDGLANRFGKGQAVKSAT